MIQQSDDAKKLFAYLLLTCKNVSLYPEGHSISTNSIRQFHETLKNYIRQYGDVRIEVERDRVICQGVEVHTGASEEGTLPFTLFRDGIRWIEFADGIELEELRDVLSIIRKYSILAVEPEGDIVTSFWESHFDHVLYKADDFVSEQGEQSDETPPPEEAPEAEEVQMPDIAAIEATESGGITIDPAVFVLTPDEKTELQEMISREEKSSTTDHLNMLLDMLLQYQEEKDFNVILEVLSEEFESAVSRYDFEAALIIMDGVRKILDSGRLRPPWAGPLIESFYKDISSNTRCLKPLEQIWSNLNVRQIETIEQIFRHLTPASVETLVNLLLLGQPSKLEQITENTIASLVHQDTSRLDRLMSNPDEKIAEKLIPVLAKLGGNVSLKHMTKLIRHSSSSVRRAAAKAFSQTHGINAVLFELIEDHDVAVRKVILTQISQSRSDMAEKFLLEYLQSKPSGAASIDHLLECFRALGKCGSANSIPFLKKTLLQSKWKAFFKTSAYREGAALALAALNIPEAGQVIEEAGRSVIPGLRRIAREAQRDLSPKSKGGK